MWINRATWPRASRSNSWSRRTFLAAASGAVIKASGPPEIDVWYGPRQHFGRQGLPQPWVNILGSVSPAAEVARIEYSVNGGEPTELSKGPDLRRLARPGDFNADIHVRRLQDGLNEVVIRAFSGDGSKAERTVEVEFAQGKHWPLPYEVDWSAVDSIADVAQIVDGQWRLENGGVRTVEPYYDRLLAFGDMDWTDYRVDVDVTFHGFPGKRPGGPHFNVNHAGIGLRWRGHAEDANQPHTQWFPLGAATEFTLEKNLEECRWRILPGPPEGPRWAEHPDPIQLGRPYILTAEVKTLEDGSHRYRTRLQEQDRNRFDYWSAESIEPPSKDFSSGSLLLVAHNSDVTFGRLRVEPI